MTHDLVFRHVDSEYSLRCSCGHWKGAHPVDNAGWSQHVRQAVHAELCNTLADAVERNGPITPAQLRGLALLGPDFVEQAATDQKEPS
jgi:hypothetical protein